MPALDWRLDVKELKSGDLIFIRGDTRIRLGLDVRTGYAHRIVQITDTSLSEYCIQIEIELQKGVTELRWIRTAEVLCKQMIPQRETTNNGWYPLRPRATVTYPPYVPPPPRGDVLRKIGHEGK